METGTLDVAGCPVRWWADGSGGPALVLTHGGAAHSGWWAPVLPRLIAGQRVAWLDFSGHGESGHRTDGYDTETWAGEIAAVIAHAIGGPAVIVGHSMGGRVGTIAAARHPEAVAALVILDSLVPIPAEPLDPPVGRNKLYPSREAAIAAFRLIPTQPDPADGDTLTAVAERAVTASEGGWKWRFDRRIFDSVRVPDATNDVIPEITCPVVAIHGEHSDVAHPDLVADFSARLGRTVPLITIPGAHHHVTLDTPDALADVLAWLPETAKERAQLVDEQLGLLEGREVPALVELVPVPRSREALLRPARARARKISLGKIEQPPGSVDRLACRGALKLSQYRRADDAPVAGSQ